MQCPFQIFSQSDYMIQIVDINSHTKWQRVQIQISWLLQKPTDLDLHCLQRQHISGFSRTRVKSLPYFTSLFACLKHLVAEQLALPTSEYEEAEFISWLYWIGVSLHRAFQYHPTRYDLNNIERDVKHQKSCLPTKCCFLNVKTERQTM